MDLKRARFRADSTPHDDKLDSCAQIRCGEPPLPRVPSRRSRKRVRVDSRAEDPEGTPSVASSSQGHRKTVSVSSSTKRQGREESDKPRPTKRIRSSSVSPKDLDGDAMEVDDDDPSQTLSNRHPSPPKSPRRPPPPPKASSSGVKSKDMSNPSPTPKPRSKGSVPGTTVPLQRSPLSASFTAPSPSQNGTRPRPTTPTKQTTKLEVEILTKSPSMISLSSRGANKHVVKKGSVTILKDDSMTLRSGSAAGTKRAGSLTRGESTKKSSKSKKVGEIVDTSIDGEAEWV